MLKSLASSTYDIHPAFSRLGRISLPLLVESARPVAEAMSSLRAGKAGPARLRNRVEEGNETKFGAFSFVLGGEFAYDLDGRQGVAPHDLHQGKVEQTLVGSVDHFRADQLVGAEEIELEVVRLSLVTERAYDRFRNLLLGQRGRSTAT